MEKDRPTVLLVEDEPIILMTLSRLLRRDNVCVVEALDAEEAISLLSVGVSVSVALTDVHFPTGRTGLELARWLRQLAPDMRIFITSGQEVGREALRELGLLKNFIPKPYDMKALAMCLTAEARAYSDKCALRS